MEFDPGSADREGWTYLFSRQFGKFMSDYPGMAESKRPNNKGNKSEKPQDV